MTHNLSTKKIKDAALSHYEMYSFFKENYPTLAIKCITFVYIFVCISSYMICSIQDFKNCFTGIVYTIVCIIVCMFLFPGVFAVAYNGLIFVLKLTIINLALSVLMFLLFGTNKK